MEIQKTLDYLIEFRKNTESSKNRKYAEKFTRILNELSLKHLDEINRSKLNYELKLVQQNFEIEKENINIKRELDKFLKFLRSEFSMTIPWYYTYIGALIGLVATIFFGFISVIFGLLIGGLFGYLFDNKAKKEGKQLNTEVNEFIF